MASLSSNGAVKVEFKSKEYFEKKNKRVKKKKHALNVDETDCLYTRCSDLGRVQR